MSPHPHDYFNYVLDARHHAQVGHATWSTDVATSSTFSDPFSCGAFVRGSTDNGNLSQFCDRALDAGSAAGLAARSTEANKRWAALDRRPLAAAPLVPLSNPRALLLVSDRVGNAQIHVLHRPLLDQFWVR